MRRTTFLILPALIVVFVLGGRLLIADPAVALVTRHECRKCGNRCECTPENNCGCILAASREGETPGGRDDGRQDR